MPAGKGSDASMVREGGGARSADEAPMDSTGIRLALLGAVVAVLAPLAGFLGGSMAGSSRNADLDPMFVWLLVGLMIGGIGTVAAVVGGMRFARANRHRF